MACLTRNLHQGRRRPACCGLRSCAAQSCETLSQSDRAQTSLRSDQVPQAQLSSMQRDAGAGERACSFCLGSSRSSVGCTEVRLAAQQHKNQRACFEGGGTHVHGVTG